MVVLRVGATLKWGQGECGAARVFEGGRGGAVLLRHPFDFLKAKHVSMAGLAELKLRLGSKRLVPIPGCDGIVCWVCVALVINDYGVLQA